MVQRSGRSSSICTAHWEQQTAGKKSTAVLLIALGFKQGQSNPCIFRHQSCRTVCAVHGDDLTFVGPADSLKWIEDEMRKKYELKVGGKLGPGENDDKEATVLNRVIRWCEDSIEYEADPRQAEKLVYELGLEGAKTVVTPGLKVTPEQISRDLPLPESKITMFRASSARSNYLSADRIDLCYSAKEVCRFMSAPTELSVVALKRIGRYLEGHKRMVYKYPRQTVDSIDVYSDTDWAGCPRTRKSTSGGCIML